MIRSLATAVIVIGSIVVSAANVSAQDLSPSSRFLSSRGSSFSQSPRSSRVLSRYLGSQRFDSGFDRSTSYGLHNSLYYYSPYQNRTSYGFRANSHGYPYGYGYGYGSRFDSSQTFRYGFGF